jgi:hypothetical protein
MNELELELMRMKMRMEIIDIVDHMHGYLNMLRKARKRS